MIKLSDLLKNALLLLILIYIAPLLIEAIRQQYHLLLDQKTKVGVLSIHEPLYDAQPYIQTFAKLCKDPEIKAILLHIQCPGGCPGAAQALYNEILTLKKEYAKPIGAYIENMATSGGYYVAASADFIVATPAAFIGNIGVYIQQLQLKEFINHYKINYSVTQTGAYKTVGDMFLDQTETGKRMLQSLTDEIYQQFIKDIAHVRTQLSLEKAHEWADGKTFTGSKALELGLIDATGSPSTAEMLLHKHTPIDGDIEWVYAHNDTSLANKLFNTEPRNDSFAQLFIQYCAGLLRNQAHLPQ